MLLNTNLVLLIINHYQQYPLFHQKSLLFNNLTYLLNPLNLNAKLNIKITEQYQNKNTKPSILTKQILNTKIKYTNF